MNTRALRPNPRPTESAGAFRALLTAAADPRTPDCDRDGLRRVFARWAAELRKVPWATPGVRRHAQRLADGLRER